MDDSSVAARTRKLRRELERIEQEERRIYRGHTGHSLAEMAEHKTREERVLAIREELRTLIEKAKEQSRHGSVWYS
jgi:hypothetical protein